MGLPTPRVTVETRPVQAGGACMMEQQPEDSHFSEY